MIKVICELVKNDCDLKAAFEVRKRVFVEEQGISEQEEMDGHDGEAVHVVAKDGERVVGTARVRFLDYGQVKLERMAVLLPFRRMGIGTAIVSFLTEELKDKQVEMFMLHALDQAIGFYKTFGFVESGVPFFEAGIRHTMMEKAL